MSSTRRNPGRVAGVLYLLLFTAPLRLIYIPGTLFVPGNASATANNIAAHETLFRLGIFSDLFTATAAIFLVLALYRLFKGVDQNLSVLMVILGGLMVTPIYFLNTLNDAAALMLACGADFLAVFDKSQRDALAMLFVRLHHQGVVANEIFWGLWLLPLAVLIYRSGFLPRFLGVWLVFNGFAYVVVSFTGLMFPQYEDRVSNVIFPALLGELALVWRSCGLAAPVSEKRIGRNRYRMRRLWGLNVVRSGGQGGEAGRSTTDARMRVETTLVRGAHGCPGRERRAVHRRCDQPRRTRQPGLGRGEWGRGWAMCRAGAHHEVSGCRNPTRAVGNSRSMMIISPC